MKRCGTVYLAAKKSVKMKWLLLCTIFLLLAISVNSISDNDDDEDEFSDGEDVIENNELPEPSRWKLFYLLHFGSNYV